MCGGSQTMNALTLWMSKSCATKVAEVERSLVFQCIFRKSSSDATASH